MKKYVNRILSLLTWALVLFVILQRFQIWREDNRKRGLEVPQDSIQILQADGGVLVSKIYDDPRKAIIFWATWCGPCRMELARIQKMIEQNEISPRNILAISIHEDPVVVSKAVKERGYTFPIGLDLSGAIAQRFAVSATPTSIFVENGKVVSASTGLSLMVERNLKEFLHGHE